MKKILLLITTSILGSFFINFKTKAQTSPSPTPNEKIQGIREKVQEKVQEQIENIVNEDQKKSWAGTITSTNETSFEISQEEQTRTVSFNEEIKIINQDREEITFQDLEKDRYVLAMGYEKIDGTLNAKRIVITEPYQRQKRISIYGTVVNKADGEKIVLIKSSDQEYELLFDSKTGINQKTDSEVEKIEYQNIITEQKVIAVIKPADGETNSYIALEILVTTPKASPTPTEDE